MSGTRHGADEALAAALAAGQTVPQAAAAGRVSERTVYRRLQSPEFRARVQQLRQEVLFQTSGRLAGAAGEAADVPRALLSDTAPRIRLRAAVAVLHAMLRVHEQ